MLVQRNPERAAPLPLPTLRQYLARASTAYKRKCSVKTQLIYLFLLFRSSDGRCSDQTVASQAGEECYSHYFILVESFISLTFCRNFDYYCEISTANIYIYIYMRYRKQLVYEATPTYFPESSGAG